MELVADALKGTTWLAIFSWVSKVCKAAAFSVEEDEASLNRLNVGDLVRSVELMTWAFDHGLPPTQRWHRLCDAAARGGHLETLIKWLHFNGYEWDEDTCSGAAEGGHLETLKWLRANGCPWTRMACTWAA